MNSECWVAYLGKLSVKTDEAIFDKRNEEGQIYDIFDINLDNILFMYFESRNKWEDYKKESHSKQL